MSLSTVALSGSTVSENKDPYNSDSDDYYFGYRAEDEAKPFAKFWHPLLDHVSSDVQRGLSSSPWPSCLVYPPELAGMRMSEPGYHNMETGWTVGEDGALMVAVRTDIPEISGEAYHWWFGWHLTDPSRYKLWNPISHQYAWRHPNKMEDWKNKSLPERYIGTRSFIYEFLGKEASKLTVAFIDPKELGFEPSKFKQQNIEAVVVGHILAGEHAATGSDGKSYLVHQVRRMQNGKRELRSRYWLAKYNEQLGHDLVVHCNMEMNRECELAATTKNAMDLFFELTSPRS
ncbi:hypothetical protein CDD83_4868 [Cordyceps sp. RAO-2017]|nr:hypothetical protein CDD83_4868 [Cordyceps sp. RAO-2017]